VCGHFALAGRQLGFDRAACTEVFKAPDANLMRSLAVQRTSGDMAPEGFALEVTGTVALLGKERYCEWPEKSEG
jgi:hypothetical protein